MTASDLFGSNEYQMYVFFAEIQVIPEQNKGFER